MATTAQLRAAYPEFLVRQGYVYQGKKVAPRCDFRQAVPVQFLAGGAIPAGRISLRVHPAAAQAFRALAAVLLYYGYAFRETAGGTLSCRAITNGILSTLHLHGIAVDLNPSKNRYKTSIIGGLIQWGRETDMPEPMIRAVEAIRYNNGQKAFEWGGRWWTTKDPMHFEVDVTRPTTWTGINTATVVGWDAYLSWATGTSDGAEDDDMIPIDSTKVRPIVVRLQEALNRAAIQNGFPPTGVDGKAGPDTARAATAYRAGSGLEPIRDGYAFDGATIGALLALYGKDSP